LATAGAYGAMSAFGPSLWAAMKYDRDAVLKSFRLHSANTDARVKAGIEANRKGPMLFTFKDAAGKILENVHVKVVQKTHDFKYGADIFMLDEIGDSKEKNEAYKEHFAAAFNLATLPFYWKDIEPEEGKTRYAKNSPKIYRRPPPDLCVEWCEAHGIEPKAHCLNYSGQTPDWAVGDIHKEKYLLEKRFRELAERYAVIGNELRFLTITSAARVHTVQSGPDGATAAETGAAVIPGVWLRAQRSAGTKCVRCWHLTDDVGSDAAHPELCARCAGNVSGRTEVRQHV
jgi:hypothetical protein